jgi:predicted negative regulator of RcsB-dependent stress response
MKSDHRHELKTNELAEWLGNLPQWTKENLVTIICIVGVIVAIIAFYAWRNYNRNILQVREQTEFTNLLNQIAINKAQIVQAQSDGYDRSFILLQSAKSLETFAMNTKSNQMAALALIKRAETLRADLHYRSGNISNQDLTTQINSAKNSYDAAIKRCPTNPSLTSTARFGLGLCEEELGNFDQAKEIYQGIVANADFEGTLAVTQAKQRLDSIDEYSKEVTFRPAPKPITPIEITSADVKRTIGYQPPEGAPNAPQITITPQGPNLVSESVEGVPPSNRGQDARETGLEPLAPNNVPTVPEANVLAD